MTLFKKVFPRPNLSNGWTCPLCKTAKETPVVLFPIPGTQDGHLVQANQIHAACLEYGLAAVIDPMPIEPG